MLILSSWRGSSGIVHCWYSPHCKLQWVALVALVNLDTVHTTKAICSVLVTLFNVTLFIVHTVYISKSSVRFLLRFFAADTVHNTNIQCTVLLTLFNVHTVHIREGAMLIQDTLPSVMFSSCYTVHCSNCLHFKVQCSVLVIFFAADTVHNTNL